MSGTQESSAAEKRGRKKVAPQGWGGGGGGDPGARGWEHRLPAEPRTCRGAQGPLGWASPRGPRLQQHPSGACGVAKALKP